MFGSLINETSVIRAFKCFEKHRVLTPKKVQETSWHGLVGILDKGGYTRCDFKTSDKLLEVVGNLNEKYRGGLNAISF